MKLPRFVRQYSHKKFRHIAAYIQFYLAVQKYAAGIIHQRQHQLIRRRAERNIIARIGSTLCLHLHAVIVAVNGFIRFSCLDLQGTLNRSLLVILYGDIHRQVTSALGAVLIAIADIHIYRIILRPGRSAKSQTAEKAGSQEKDCRLFQVSDHPDA